MSPKLIGGVRENLAYRYLVLNQRDGNGNSAENYKSE